MTLDDKTRDEIALFRYALIADLLHGGEGQRGIYAHLNEKAQREYQIPGSRRTRVAAETIRDWLAAYRAGGFDALRPRPRRDRGQPRAIAQEIADLLCQLKEQTPALSIKALIEHVRERSGVGDLQLAPATVHRLLS